MCFQSISLMCVNKSQCRLSCTVQICRTILAAASERLNNNNVRSRSELNLCSYISTNYCFFCSCKHHAFIMLISIELKWLKIAELYKDLIDVQYVEVQRHRFYWVNDILHIYRKVRKKAFPLPRLYINFTVCPFSIN